jgi:hypothetical protein
MASGVDCPKMILELWLIGVVIHTRGPMSKATPKMWSRTAGYTTWGQRVYAGETMELWIKVSWRFYTSSSKNQTGLGLAQVASAQGYAPYGQLPTTHGRNAAEHVLCFRTAVP